MHFQARSLGPRRFGNPAQHEGHRANAGLACPARGLEEQLPQHIAEHDAESDAHNQSNQLGSLRIKIPRMGFWGLP
jgi:hypothetical protein